MKRIAYFFIMSFLTVSLFAIDFKQVDQNFIDGQFQQAYDSLIAEFNKDEPNAAILWRLGRYYYEISDKKPSKKEVIAGCETGLEFLEPYLDTSVGEDADRARVVQWYDVLLSRRGQAKGIKESLNRIPDFFAYADKAISICPTIPEPYHLKAMIDKELPSLFGGDFVRMSQNFMKAMECAPNVIVFMVDAADGFIGRNWDANKKVSKGDVYSPKGLSDKEFAKQLLNKVMEISNSGIELSKMDLEKIKLAKDLLKKVN